MTATHTAEHVALARTFATTSTWHNGDVDGLAAAIADFQAAEGRLPGSDAELEAWVNGSKPYADYVATVMTPDAVKLATRRDGLLVKVLGLLDQARMVLTEATGQSELASAAERLYGRVRDEQRRAHAKVEAARKAAEKKPAVQPKTPVNPNVVLPTPAAEPTVTTPAKVGAAVSKDAAVVIAPSVAQVTPPPKTEYRRLQEEAKALGIRAVGKAEELKARIDAAKSVATAKGESAMGKVTLDVPQDRADTIRKLLAMNQADFEAMASLLK
jgi:hypothetical protein